MSKSEDYLDSLLNNVSSGKKSEEQKKRENTEFDFSEEFEKELNDVDMDNFIRDFEIEVDSDNDLDISENAEDSFFDNLEGIVQNAREASKQNKEETEPEGSDFEINTLEDDAWTEPQEKAEPVSEDVLDESKELQESPQEPERSAEEQELLDLLADLPTEEELANIGESFQSEESKGDLEQEESAEESEDSELSGAAFDEAEPSEGKKKGFLQKLLSVIFGDEKEDELSETEDAASAVDAGLDDLGLSNMSEENRQILNELNAAGKKEKDTDSEKNNKKKKKKEKKEKVKKEKKSKEKKEKKPKEKKPKKPKEVDLSPPLPRKPVILIFIMGISIILLVMLMANLTGYSMNISEAKEAFASMDYVEAYQQLTGLELKEQDTELYERVSLLAKVQSELDNGKALYEAKQYNMALDSYICALGRYDANYGDAVTWGIQEEYDALAEQIAAQLGEKFGVSVETAREIYGIRDRKEYTKRIYEIVEALGLTE